MTMNLSCESESLLEKRDYWLWLTRIPNLGQAKIKALLAFCGSPYQLFDMSADDFGDLFQRRPFRPGDAKLFFESRDKRGIWTYKERLESLKIGYITIDDADYPSKLYGLYEPVYLFYYRGQYKAHRLSISIVGSRRATAYGRKVAEVFAGRLAAAGVNVISGMATGIDGFAHKGALKEGGFTTAILGCGINVCYPKDHRYLMEEIIKKGCVISEYGLDVPPRQGYFPLRNRLISALSDGVVLVEAKEKSGSLITIDYALDQGRDVYAVPGDVLGASNKGSNHIIRGGGKPVFEVEDILEEYGILPNNQGASPLEIEKTLEEREKIVYSCISLSPVFIDAIARETGFEMNELQFLLTKLEIKGAIHQLPNKHYVRY